jgi:hypothetical protein
MVAHGILDERPGEELVEGDIVITPARTALHQALTMRLRAPRLE